MSDTQKQAVQKQANGASPKPKPQNNKNTNTSNDGFKSMGKPRNQQNGANGSQKPNNNNNNKPKQANNNNNNSNNANGQQQQQRRRKEGGNANGNNKPKQQQGNQQQAPSTPTLRGKLTAEQYELVVEVVQGTGGYFSEQEAWATLQENNQNAKHTIEVLNQKKGSNWSAMVRKGLPQAQPVVQQQQPAAPKEKPQSRPNQKKKTETQANGHQVEKVDPIVKEQDLIRDIENNLEEWAKLKNQLESVKNGELQSNLTKLGEDRALLKKRQGELEQELKTIKSTLVTVETEINKLEKEKAQQLKALEEEKVKLLAKAKK
jgi:hypothetical protein